MTRELEHTIPSQLPWHGSEPTQFGGVFFHWFLRACRIASDTEHNKSLLPKLSKKMQNFNTDTVLSNMHNYKRSHKDHQQTKDQVNLQSCDAIPNIWIQNTSMNIWNLLSIAISNTNLQVITNIYSGYSKTSNHQRTEILINEEESILLDLIITSLDTKH